MTSRFMAGAARVPFTPDSAWYPLYRDLGGSPETLPAYQRITNVLTESLDDMYARAVAVRSGEDTILLITVDYICVRGGVDKVKELSRELGLPEENICLIATHTHNMPMTAIQPGFMASEDSVRALLEKVPARRSATGSSASAWIGASIRRPGRLWRPCVPPRWASATPSPMSTSTGTRSLTAST